MKNILHTLKRQGLLLAILTALIGLVPEIGWGQVMIFTESMGTVSATTTIATHETANGFDNDGYTMTAGGIANPGDIRATSPSSGYTGASGSANVWLTNTSGAYGFAIEGIDASSFTSLTVQFGYRKESGSALPTLALDYWDGSSYVNIPFTFNEAANAASSWYFSPIISLPTGAQINNLRLRWVKTGTIAVRIDDVILKGTGGSTAPTVTTHAMTSISTTSATGNGNITATGGVNPTARGFCWDLSTNPDPDLADSHTTESGSFSIGAFSGSITSLTAGTEYKARAYATNSGGTSYGNVVTFTTLFPEPSNFPSSFSAIANTSSSQITTAWIDANTGQLPQGYLVKAAIDPAVPSAPFDGIAESNGTLVKNITQGTQQIDFTGLNIDTKYNFSIWPYTNSGTNINYTLGSQPTASATTLSAYSDIIAVASSESATISSLIVDLPPLTSTTGVQVWQITIRDGGSSMNDPDALPTIVTGITLAQDAGNAINDWAKAIRTISLFDGTNNIATATVSATQIIFSGMNLSVSDNSSKTISLRLSLNAPLNSPDAGNYDGDDFVFSLADGNFTTRTDGTSSLKGTFSAAKSANGSNVLSIVATKIAFDVQPTNTEINATMSPDVIVRSTDIYNNIDRDYSSVVTITSEGVMNGDPVTVNPVSGIATCTPIIHTALANGIHLNATSGSLSSIASNAFNITSINYINGDYRTTGSGVWTSNSPTPAIWQRYNGVSWSSSNSPSSNTSNTIYIVDGTTITTNGSMGNSAKLVIMANGTFNNNHSSTYALVKVLANGNLNINASISISGSGSLEVEDDANMTINFSYGTPSTSIWNGTENFHPAANLIFTNWDGANDVILPSNTAISTNTYNGFTAAFGNIIFDFDSNLGASDDLIILESGISINLAHGDLIFRTNATVGADFRLSTVGTVTSGIGGDFIIEDSYVGSNNINLKSSGSLNFTINGSWLQDACNVRINTGSNDGNSSTINILGNMSLTPSSSIDFNSTVTSNNVTSTINLNGDLSASSSALIQNSNSSRNGIFNFSGTGDGLTPETTQIIDISSTSSSENRYINFNVKSGSYVKLANRNFELGTNSTLTIENGGTLDFGFSGSTPLILTNSGSMIGTTLIQNSGGHLIITSTAGIASSGATGNVQTTTRSFNTGGNFTYTGTATQVTGSGLPATVNNLTIDNSGGVSLTNPAVTVSSTLLINAGKKFFIGPLKEVTATNALTNYGGEDGLTIQSDATGTGSLLHNTADVPATIERYVDGNSLLTDWRYHWVSVPLTPASNNFSIIFLYSYLFDFDEENNKWNGLGTPIDTPLDETRGYMTYAPFNIGATYKFTGPLNSNNIGSEFEALVLYHGSGVSDLSKGWNLVPNPFPSAIDWAAVSGWTKTRIDGSIYFWPSGNPSSQTNYSAWNNSSGPAGSPPGSQYIPAGQSFLIHANDAGPALKMTNSVRVHNSHSFWKNTSGIIPNLLRIKAISPLSADEIIIHIMDDATENFDTEFDAYKLTGGTDAPQLASFTPDGTKLSINSLPFSATEKIIPLYFSLNKASEITFTATGQENFAMTPPIYLEDLLLNKVIDLQQLAEYTFAYQPGQTNRFQLRFMDITSTGKDIKNDGAVFYSNGKINIDVPGMEGKQVVINTYDVAGRCIKTTNTTINGIVQVDAPLATGVYIIRVISGNNTFVRKVVVR